MAFELAQSLPVGQQGIVVDSDCPTDSPETRKCGAQAEEGGVEVNVQRDPVGACSEQLDEGRERFAQGGQGRVVVDLQGTPDLHEPGERAPQRGERRVVADGEAPGHAADDRVVVRR